MKISDLHKVNLISEKLIELEKIYKLMITFGTTVSIQLNTTSSSISTRFDCYDRLQEDVKRIVKEEIKELKNDLKNLGVEE